MPRTRKLAVPKSEKPININNQLNNWVYFPEQLLNSRFKSFENRDDETQNRGAFVIGQNMTFNSSYIPTMRKGYAVVGAELANSTPVNRAWVYETREGIQWELKAYNDSLYGYAPGVTNDFVLLKSGFTPGLTFGYGNIGKSSEFSNHTYFCNGIDNFFRFNGVYASYVSNDGVNIVRYTPPSTTVDLPFYSTGNIIINGTNISYTGQFSNYGSLYLQYNPQDGDTVVINGVTFTFVLTITGVAGQVLTSVIVDNTSNPFAIANLLDLMANPSVTNSNHVALSAPNQAIIANITAAQQTNSAAGIINLSTINLAALTVTSSQASNPYYAIHSAFTGCSALPTAVAGDLIIQAPQELTSGGTNPIKGQVVFAHDGRLHARNEAKKSVWNYSKLDDPSNFTTGSSDGDGGAKEIEMGGPLVAFGVINQKVVGFKTRLLKSLEFNQVGSKVDSPLYATLTPTDDKGTSLGAFNQKSTFSSPLGLVFVTPDKRMVLLTGVTANNEPQYISISDLVQPIFSTGIHDQGSGICVDNTIWYSFKQDSTSTFNDVVIRGDLTRQSMTADRKVLPVCWDTPYVGWNVNDWTAVRNATTGTIDVHWHSSINSNTYSVTTDKTDNTLPFTSTLRTWSEAFGEPYNQKKIDYVYIEVKMSQSTKLLATLLYDEDGVTQSKEFTLLGTDPQIFDSSVYNPFGANPYGSQMFGSNPTSSSLKKYRYWLETDNNKYFFNLSLQLSAADPGCDFELIRFGYRLTESPVDVDWFYKKNIN